MDTRGTTPSIFRSVLFGELPYNRLSGSIAIAIWSSGLRSRQVSGSSFEDTGIRRVKEKSRAKIYNSRIAQDS